jgi:hypothetical protein
MDTSRRSKSPFNRFSKLQLLMAVSSCPLNAFQEEGERGERAISNFLGSID